MSRIERTFIKDLELHLTIEGAGLVPYKTAMTMRVIEARCQRATNSLFELSHSSLQVEETLRFSLFLLEDPSVLRHIQSL